MKRNKVILLVISVTFLALLSIGINFYRWVNDINRLPKDKYLFSEGSPNGTYRLNIYTGGGGATVGYSIIGEIENTETGKKRNLYFEYHCQDAEVEWLDDETVIINGKKLNVLTDSYAKRTD